MRAALLVLLASVLPASLSAQSILHEETSAPPEVAGAAEFAPHFGTYADGVAATEHPVAPADLPAWLAAHVTALEADPCDSGRNRIAATALLGCFLQDPSLWRDCGWLNCWDAAADRSFADHLDAWAAHLAERGLTARTPELVRASFLATGAGRE